MFFNSPDRHNGGRTGVLVLLKFLPVTQVPGHPSHLTLIVIISLLLYTYTVWTLFEKWWYYTTNKAFYFVRLSEFLSFRIWSAYHLLFFIQPVLRVWVIKLLVYGCFALCEVRGLKGFTRESVSMEKSG